MATNALVSFVFGQLAPIAEQEIEKQVCLVVGVGKEVEELTSTLQSIQAKLFDAEKTQVKEKSVKVWLEKLDDISYDMIDVLDERYTKVLKLQNENARSAQSTLPKKVYLYILSPCFCLGRVASRLRVAIKIKEIKERLEVMAKEAVWSHPTHDQHHVETEQHYQTSSSVDKQGIYGRNVDIDVITSMLCDTPRESEVEMEMDLHIVAIVGMEGIGKTTLAQLAFGNDKVKAHFGQSIWVCSNPFDVMRIGKAILETLEGNAPNVVELDSILQKIKNSVVRKRFLLVLDDVRTEVEADAKWKQLKNSLNHGAPGSAILITTPNQTVAKMMGALPHHTHPLGTLPDKDCWSLLSHKALFGRTSMDHDREKLEEIGMKIAQKCKGLPLAAETLGRLLSSKSTKEGWQNVLESEMWELEEVEKGVFPPLLSSYNDLHLAVKRCLSYCAIFPKDTYIERDNLIKLWMAQGYLSSEKSHAEDMELTGREYFEKLKLRFFFQDVDNDDHDQNDGKIIGCNIHPIVHDLAQFLRKNECLITEMNSGINPSAHKKIRHLTLLRGKQVPFGVPLVDKKAAEKLHTLWVSCSIHNFPDISVGADKVKHALKHSECLRALDMSGNRLFELPRMVGKLIHLRYLNLSHNPLVFLPDTVCDLYNLQTLRLSGCYKFEKLPAEMGNLSNLRHLELDDTKDLKTLPEGIGTLSSLRTLSKYIVRSTTVYSHPEEGCKLRDLGNLKHLEGHLKIIWLGDVGDASEVEKAQLKDKKNLHSLVLEFSDPFRNPQAEDMDVIEALKPQPNLQDLTMDCYKGTRFPSWIVLLGNLRKLCLCKGINCVELPPLGKLRSLEILEIKHMDSLIRVDLEFFGLTRIDGGDDKPEKDDEIKLSSSSSSVSFPRLKELRFSGMVNWEEWNGPTKTNKIGGVKIMPCLSYLQLSDCYKLKELPHFLQMTETLNQLVIQHCIRLRRRCQKHIGEDWSKISHIPNIQIP